MGDRRVDEPRDEPRPADGHNPIDVGFFEVHDRLEQAGLERPSVGGVDGVERSDLDSGGVEYRHELLLVGASTQVGVDGDNTHRAAAEPPAVGEAAGHTCGEVVVGRQEGRPQIRREFVEPGIVDGVQRDVEHEGFRVGVTRAGILLELPGHHHGERLVVLGDRVAERLFSHRSVGDGIEDMHLGIDSSTRDAAAGVDVFDQRRYLGFAVAFGRHLPTKGRGHRCGVGDDERHRDRVVGDPRRVGPRRHYCYRAVSSVIVDAAR